MRPLTCVDQDGVLSPSPLSDCDYTSPLPVELCGRTACYER